ncbi:hypothetical protein JW921_09090 [Candidatus Fermentibacterales bacterium]|nr:hypothetical protein [Candidatus Fermentibacterales bacterium]
MPGYLRRNLSGLISLSAACFGQFLLELTLGRVFVAPNLVSIVLVYLMINRGKFWEVDGAFWAGILLDGLLRTPPGSSSLALMIAMKAGGAMLSSLSIENRAVFFLTIGIVSLVSDLLTLVLSSRPFLMFFDWSWAVVLPRSLLTVSVAGIWVLLAGGAARRGSETGA